MHTFRIIMMDLTKANCNGSFTFVPTEDEKRDRFWKHRSAQLAEFKTTETGLLLRFSNHLIGFREISAVGLLADARKLTNVLSSVYCPIPVQSLWNIVWRSTHKSYFHQPETSFLIFRTLFHPSSQIHPDVERFDFLASIPTETFDNVWNNILLLGL